MNLRELEAKVAKLLGFVVRGNWVFDQKDETVGRLDEGIFLTGNGMLLLIEEARKQGIYLEWEQGAAGFKGFAWKGKPWKVYAGDSDYVQKPALSLVIAFLKAHGVDVTPYLEGVNAG